MDLDLDRGSDRQREQHLKVGKHLTGFALSPVDAVGSVDLVKVVLRFWGNDSRVEMRPGLARRARRERSGDGRAEGSGSRCVRALAAQPSWGCPHPTGVRGGGLHFHSRSMADVPQMGSSVSEANKTRDRSDVVNNLSDKSSPGLAPRTPPAPRGRTPHHAV